MELTIQDVTFSIDGTKQNSDRIPAIADQYLALNATTERLANRYDPMVLQAMRRVVPLTQLDEASKDYLNQWVSELIALLVKRADSTISFASDVEFQSADNWQILITITTHGLESEQRFSREFFASNEYRRLSTMGEILDTKQSGLTVLRGDNEHAVDSLRQGFEWLLQESRRTLHVQRYKGLGEMNPEQLWDTTMDAEKRNLMQVQIEDAVAADQIFSTLMGDQVEPRRLFIEEHALSVTNLDT